LVLWFVSSFIFVLPFIRLTYIVAVFKLNDICLEKVQITPLKYNQSLNNPLKYFFGSLYPLNYAQWFNLPLKRICLFCFFMHKWCFKFNFYKFIEQNIRYVRKIFHKFFISIWIGNIFNKKSLIYKFI
jgi:hypothetical protein